MILDRLIEDRETWQDNTVKEIRKRLLFKSKQVIKAGNGEKLVAIYGPPQIGKTTLILFLLGNCDRMCS